MITDNDIAQAREVDLRGFLGVRRSGRYTQIKCPFHADDTPSCAIYDDSSYRCYGCGVYGSGSISFLMAIGDTFQDAVRRLLGRI